MVELSQQRQLANGNKALAVVNDDGSAIGGAAATATGTDTYRNAALTNTAVAVKASAGNLYDFDATNPDVATDAYLHFYDVAAGSVTVGTTTPKMSIWLPKGGANSAMYAAPKAFATAISVAASTTPTGGTAPATAIVFNAGYK